MERSPADLEGLMQALCDAEVSFIVVGGIAAVLHGSPTTTHDLDIVPEQSTGNLERLMSVLRAHRTLVRDPAGRRLEPSDAALAGSGQIQLVTDLGPLDILCRLHDGRGYDELLAQTVTIDAGELHLRVLDLPALIEVKGSTGRARDRMVVPLLLALLRERERSSLE
ncbi:MAG: hypothetical protein KC501_37180 [Myxococcales bacterium]|nr:hypothetical protein [Myxococcales bacterium]